MRVLKRVKAWVVRKYFKIAPSQNSWRDSVEEKFLIISGELFSSNFQQRFFSVKVSRINNCINTKYEKIKSYLRRLLLGSYACKIYAINFLGILLGMYDVFVFIVFDIFDIFDICVYVYIYIYIYIYICIYHI